MASGDIKQVKRVRLESNERLDTPDSQALSTSAIEHLDFLVRSLAVTPLKTAAAPTGMIVTGGSATVNPTSGSDGKVRVNTEAFVGLDADGRLIVKLGGTTIDIDIPAGDHQVYFYHDEEETDKARRRFISVSPPFSESSRSVDTRFVSSIQTYVRAGTIASAVAEDNVGGQTRALLLWGIANNTAGAVTFTPQTNRISALNPSWGGTPPTAPASNTANGDEASLHDLILRSLFYVADAKWAESTTYTPAAANNYGAYKTVAVGVDRAGREIQNQVTIGNGTTIFGTFDRSNYASDDLLLAAAITEAASRGVSGVGVVEIYIKPGVVLDNFAADVAFTVGTQRLRIRGDGIAVGSESDGAYQLDMDTFKFNFGAGTTNDGMVEFADLRIRGTVTSGGFGPMFELHTNTAYAFKRCRFYLDDSADTGAPKGAITVDAAATTLYALTIEDCYVHVNTGYASTTTVGFFLHLPATVAVSDLLVRNCNFFVENDPTDTPTFNIISVFDARRNIVFDGCVFEYQGNDSFESDPGYCISLNTTTNAAGSRENRKIVNCSMVDTLTDVWPHFGLVSLTDINDVVISECSVASYSTRAISIVGDTATVSGVTVHNCVFGTGAEANTSTCVHITGNTTDSVVVVGCAMNNRLGSDNRFVFLGPTVVGIIIKDNVIQGGRIECVGNSSSTCARISIVNNVINYPFATTATNFNPIGFGRDSYTGFNLNDIEIRENTISGAFTTIAADTVLGIRLIANAMKRIIVGTNTFKGLQNVAFTGGSAVTNHDIIRVRSNSIIGLHIDNNRVMSCFDKDLLSGANARAGVFVDIRDYGGTKSISEEIINCTIDNNSFSSNLIIQLAHVWGQFQNLSCSHNHLSAWYSLSGTPAITKFDKGATTSWNLKLEGNMFDIRDPGTGNFSVFDLLGSGNLYGMVFIDNMITKSVSGGTYNSTFAGTIDYFVMRNNFALIRDDVTSNNAKFKILTSGALLGSVTDPAVPSVNGYWTNNLNIQRGS